MAVYDDSTLVGEDPLDGAGQGRTSLPRVELIDAAGAVQQMVELTGRGLTIGRAPSNDIALDSPQVSRFHVRVDYDGERAQITDLGSRGGTALEGQALPPQAPQDWFWGQTIQVGPFILRVERRLEPRDGTTDMLPAAAGAALGGQIELALEPGGEALRLTPGQPTQLRLSLINRGAESARALIQADGVPAEWVQLPAQPIEVPPGGSATASILVNPPRAAASRAGEYSVALRARAQGNPADSRAVVSYWTVQPFSESAISLSPRKRTVRGGQEASYALVIRNLGNATSYYSLRVGENEPALEYDLSQSQVIIEPGDEASLQIGAAAREVPSGSSQSYSFGVVVQPSGAPPLSEMAQLQWVPLIPRWLIPAAALLLLLLLGGAILAWAFGNSNASAQSSTTPSAQASSTPQSGTAAPTADLASTEQALNAVINSRVDIARATAIAEVLAQVGAQNGASQALIEQTAQAAGNNAALTAVAQVFLQATAQAQQNGNATAFAIATQIAQGTVPAGLGGGSGSGSGAGGSGSGSGAGGSSAGGSGSGSGSTAATAAPTTAPTATATPRPAAQAIFFVQPGNIVTGQSFGSPIIVQVVDSGGALVAADTTVVLSLKISTGITGATLKGNVLASSSDGRVSFSGLSISNVANDYQLVATVTVQGRTLTVESARFNVTAGQAKTLVFTTQPGGAIANEVFTRQPVVEVRDEAGNRVASFNGAVTVSLVAGPGVTNPKLTGDATVNAQAGVARFTTLKVDKAATGYSLQVTDGTLNAQSASFSVGAGPATRLRITSAPDKASGGAAPSATSIVVRVEDRSGSATSISELVTLDIIDPLTNASLITQGPITASVDDSGIATFGPTQIAKLAINKAGTYTLQVSAQGLTTDQKTYVVEAGPFDELIFSAAPVNARAGATQTVSVQGVDAGRNPARSFSGKTITLVRFDTTVPSDPGTTIGVQTTNTNSTATFSVKIDKISQYRLQAKVEGTGDSKTSDPFRVTANQIVFKPAVASVRAGVNLAIVLEAQDSVGTLDPNYAGAVTLTLAVPAGCGAAPLTVNGSFAAGRATIGSAQITRACPGYRLNASSGSGPGQITGASNAFNVTAAAATTLAFVRPENTAGPNVVATSADANLNSALAPPVVRVEARDQFGNLDTAYGSAAELATLKLANSAAGCLSGAPLAGTTAQPFVAGVAIFNDLAVRRACADFTLQAEVAGKPAIKGASSAFAVVAGAPAGMVFTGAPASRQADEFLSASLEMQDAFGNRSLTYGDPVTLSILTAPCGAPTFNGTKTLNFVQGQVAFGSAQGLFIRTACTGYQLRATSGAITADSGLFNIGAAAPNRLEFQPDGVNGLPQNTTAGSDQRVRLVALDQFNNIATQVNGTLVDLTPTLTGAACAAAPADNLSTLDTVFVNGVVTPLFNLKRACDYTLGGQANINGAPITTPAPAPAFTVQPGLPTNVAFDIQPGTNPAGAVTELYISVNTPFPVQPRVVTTDQYGNRSATVTSVFLILKQNGNAGQLAGPNVFTFNTTNYTFVNTDATGAATFNGLQVSGTGVGYELGASLNGFELVVLNAPPQATSNPFNVDDVTGTPTLQFVAPFTRPAAAPAADTGSTDVTNPLPQFQVELIDKGGGDERITSFSGSIQIEMGNDFGNPGTIPNPKPNAAAVAGVATFNGVQINGTTVGEEYRLRAVSPNVTLGTSIRVKIQ